MGNSNLFKQALLIAFLISGITLYAQEKETTFGFKGGLNKSDVDATDINGNKSGYTGTELYGGFWADTRVTSKLNFENELLFSYTDDFHVIEMPLHLKYKLVERWNVLLGPKLDYIADSDDGNLGYKFKKFGVSGEIGTQYRFNRLFFAEMRYSKSFTPQIDNAGFEFYNGKRNTFRLGLGMNFSKAQTNDITDKPKPIHLRIGLSAGRAITSGYDNVYGADVRLQKDFKSNISGLLSAGYNHYSLVDGFVETNLAYIPIKAGLKVFPVKRFYFSTEAGIAIGTKSEIYTQPFIYAAGIGFETNSRIDIGLRYEHMTGNINDYLDEIKRPSQIALRTEYGFNLNFKKPKAVTPDVVPPTGEHRKSIFVEGWGNGLGVSGNFDIRLKPDRNDGWGLSAGGGINGTYITLPLAINYIVGKKRSGFEAGGGITSFVNSNPGYNSSIPFGRWGDSPKFAAMGLFNIGYRLQSTNGFMLKANSSAVYYKKNVHVLIPGLSIGYNFK